YSWRSCFFPYTTLFRSWTGLPHPEAFRSTHHALGCAGGRPRGDRDRRREARDRSPPVSGGAGIAARPRPGGDAGDPQPGEAATRSEEHTSELQSRETIV